MNRTRQIEPSKTEATSDRCFRFLAGLLERHSGQDLSPARYWRIETVLRPLLRVHGIPDLAALEAVLSDGTNRLLARQTVEAMLNNETSFFRDQASFSLLTGPALGALRETASRSRARKLRIWSAACSTGQEAYSLAMAMREDREKWRGWEIEIIASDVSASVVERAREGRFSQFEIQRGMPITLMLRYFRRDGDDWIAKDEITSMISFGQHNLLEPYRLKEEFDIVLCRNMIMYLKQEQRGVVFGNLARSIRRDGYLMLGAAETVIGQTDRFRASKDYRGLYEPVDCAQVRSAA